jgi:hypothetical protein
VKSARGKLQAKPALGRRGRVSFKQGAKLPSSFWSSRHPPPIFR